MAGFLAFASGAGKAGQQAFSDMARFAAADMLEQRRSEMDLLKQQRMLEAQREMHRETSATNAEAARLDRESRERMQANQIGSTEKVAGMQIEAGATNTDKQIVSAEKIAAGNQATQKEIHAADRMSHKEIAELNSETQKAIASGNRLSQEKVAKMNIEGQKSIHDADRLLKKYEIDTTSETGAKLASSKAISEVGNEITRLSALLANPMLDPETAKALNVRLRRLEGMHDGYSRSLLPPGEKGAAAAPVAKKDLPPFRFPKGFTPPPPKGKGGPLNSPGVKVLPVPGDVEQEMMRRALQ